MASIHDLRFTIRFSCCSYTSMGSRQFGSTSPASAAGHRPLAERQHPTTIQSQDYPWPRFGPRIVSTVSRATPPYTGSRASTTMALPVPQHLSSCDQHNTWTRPALLHEAYSSASRQSQQENNWPYRTVPNHTWDLAFSVLIKGFEPCTRVP
jgi:hypothetical protein